jgi:hypothetical protein
MMMQIWIQSIVIEMLSVREPEPCVAALQFVSTTCLVDVFAEPELYRVLRLRSSARILRFAREV